MRLLRVKQFRVFLEATPAIGKRLDSASSFGNLARECTALFRQIIGHYGVLVGVENLGNRRNILINAGKHDFVEASGRFRQLRELGVKRLHLGEVLFLELVVACVNNGHAVGNRNLRGMSAGQLNELAHCSTPFVVEFDRSEHVIVLDDRVRALLDAALDFRIRVDGIRATSLDETVL